MFLASKSCFETTAKQKSNKRTVFEMGDLIVNDSNGTIFSNVDATAYSVSVGNDAYNNGSVFTDQDIFGSKTFVINVS